MSLTPLGYGDLPNRFDTTGHTSCDLKIPHRAVGEDIARIIGEGMSRGPDGKVKGLSASQLNVLEAKLSKLDENFLYLERWAAFFFRNCICHCEEGGT